MSRDVATAALFAVLWFGTIGYARDHNWHPAGARAFQMYVLAGICTVVVLLTRELLPRTTLLVVVLTYPGVYGIVPATDFHYLPFFLAAYTVAAKGCLPTTVTLLLTEIAVTQTKIPLATVVDIALRREPLMGWNISRVMALEALTAAAVLLGRASYLQKRANDELRQRHLELERLRGLETDQVVSAERTRIARELHDVVAHHVSAMVIRAQAADRVADSRPGETREAVRWIAANGQETLTAMRHVVRVLRSSENGLALTPQATLTELPQIAERMSAVGLAVELRLPSILPVLPAAVELAAVRIVQEALTNVLVHAKARRALVELEISAEDEIRLAVHDDGSAEAPPTVPVRLLTAQPSSGPTSPPSANVKAPAARPGPPGSVLGGNGLIGMRERAASCGGVLTIGISPLGGWLVTAVLSSTLPSLSAWGSGFGSADAPASTLETLETSPG